MRRCVGGEGRRVPEWRFRLFREVVAESANVDTDDEREVDECETDVCDGGEGVSERGLFKRKVDEEGDGNCANTGTDGDGFGRVEVLKEGEVGVRIGAKVFACGNEAGKVVFAVTDETWLTIRKKELEKKREMEKVTEMGFQ